MSGAVIFECSKGREVFRLAVDSYRGKTFANCREWYRDGDELKPTQKGCTIPLERLPELYAALGAYLDSDASSGPENRL